MEASLKFGCWPNILIVDNFSTLPKYPNTTIQQTIKTKQIFIEVVSNISRCHEEDPKQICV